MTPVDSNPCLTDLKDAFYNKTDNIISPYLDASGHVSSGILEGSLSWLGCYDQCTSLRGGLYCLTDLTATLPSKTLNQTSKEILIRWGLCAVKSCNESILQDNMETILNDTATVPTWLNITGTQVNCSYHIPYNSGFIATICVLAFLFGMCIAGSLYHVYKIHRPVKKFIHCIDQDGAHTITPPGSSDGSPLMSPNESFQTNENSIGSISNLRVIREALREKPGKVQKILYSFCIQKNLTQVLCTSSSESSIACLHGMRFLSIAWIMLGHTFLAIFSSNIMVNPKTAIGYTKKLSWQPVGNAYFAVDTFFFLSGLLVVYIGMNEMKKREGKFSLLYYYLHRYIRLTPTMAIVMLFWIYVKPYLGSGPLWYQMQDDPLCSKYWWTNLLYIQNFYPTELEHECIGWTWYLALDMQFYIIAPIILITLYKNAKIGCILIGSITLISLVITAVLIFTYNIDINLTLSVVNTDLSAMNAYESIIYGKPYCRINTYMIGMLMGYVIYSKPKNTVNINKWLTLLGWISSTIVSLALIFGLYPTFHGHTLSLTENVAYGTLSHIAWGMVLCWIVTACHYDRGGIINHVLSWRGFIPLSRLTYTVYLIHPVIMFVLYFSQKTPFYVSDATITIYYTAVVVLSLFGSLVLMLLVQLPVVGIEKSFTKKAKET